MICCAVPNPLAARLSAPLGVTIAHNAVRSARVGMVEPPAGIFRNRKRQWQFRSKLAQHFILMLTQFWGGTVK